ncbi:MAG: sensor domain-containing diguanylate cyclase [Janthinobacterium lividum]
MTLRTILARLRAHLPALALFVPVVLACCALVGLDGWRAWDARAGAIAADNVVTGTLARSLAQHAHDTVQAVDSAVVALREAVESGGEVSGGEVSGSVESAGRAPPGAAGRLERLMRLQVHALPSIHGLLVLDAGGRPVADTIPAPHATLDMGERGYFRFHRDHPDRDAMVGEMVRLQADGAWVLILSRRVDDAGGRFAGVVAAAISVRSLQRFYGSLDVGGRTAIVLMAADGRVVAARPQDGAMIGTSVAQGAFFSRVLPRAPSGTAEFLSVVDDVVRIGSYETVTSFPLVVLVSHPRAEVLAAWRASTIAHLLVSSGAALLLALLGGCLALQVRRRLAAEMRLREKERHYRMLAENGTDLITHFDAGLRRTYASPASRTLLGYDPRELLGQEPRTLVVEEDRAAVAAAVAGLASGSAPMLLSYRLRHRDGTALWVEATGRRMEDGGGFLFTVRDISRRKAVERDLHEANARLKRLVMLDGLTGIDNRRSFDLALAREVGAAMRSGLPLSLLLIDIDHFKRLNDSHGHTVGDECLRLIAATIGGRMKRPADHLARYGGEEFAVLLPQTEGDGAAGLAARLCEAVRGLDLSHVVAGGVAGGGIAGAGVALSISIGVATLHGAQDPASGQVLVDAADRALYEAKQGGRDRVAVGEVPAADGPGAAPALLAG